MQRRGEFLLYFLVLIALGVFASKGHLLLPEIYGLNGLFTSKRNAQENFLYGCSYKLLFLRSFLSSVSELVAVSGAVLPGPPSG